jgi:large subunit ribosomal protein L15
MKHILVLSLLQFVLNLFQGADNFDAKVNIEVQWASELTIAAIEKNGGTILTRYYSLPCVNALVNPQKFFESGNPIPKCKPPPKDALEYYLEAKNRGYLADKEKIEEARMELAQKYGYLLPDITKDPLYAMLSMRKHANQLWHGLEAGWVVNLKDRTILKPTNPDIKAYYQS